ncbi:MAG: hypothetical protein IAE78_32060 [Myxococcus sp.]|nr:hypothetical protein [Myxococcus sp.]
MIKVSRPPEPERFNIHCRLRGQSWLEKHPHQRRLPDYWSEFRHELADGFKQRCGYSAMWIPEGQVDHFRSTSKNRGLAYEWDNFRYSAGWINQSKQTVDDAVIDPFEVKDDWFEIILPSLQLVVTKKVPASLREKAEYTIVRLRLRDDERVIRQRRSWFEAWERGDITLEELRRRAPLIAAAVQRQQRRR